MEDLWRTAVERWARSVQIGLHPCLVLQPARALWWGGGGARKPGALECRTPKIVHFFRFVQQTPTRCGRRPNVWPNHRLQPFWCCWLPPFSLHLSMQQGGVLKVLLS